MKGDVFKVICKSPFLEIILGFVPFNPIYLSPTRNIIS